MEDGSPPRHGDDAGAASRQLHTLLEPEQPSGGSLHGPPAGVADVEADAVVAHGYFELLPFAPVPYGDPGRLRVTEGVGHRLLSDAEACRAGGDGQMVGQRLRDDVGGDP